MEGVGEGGKGGEGRTGEREGYGVREWETWGIFRATLTGIDNRAVVSVARVVVRVDVRVMMCVVVRGGVRSVRC